MPILQYDILNRTLSPKARKRENGKGEQAQARASELLASRRDASSHRRQLRRSLRLVVGPCYEQERRDGT